MVTFKKGYLYSLSYYENELFLISEIIDVDREGVVVYGYWFKREDVQFLLWKEELFISMEDVKDWKEECRWSPLVKSLVA